MVHPGFVEGPIEPDAGARRALRVGHPVAPARGRLEGLQPAARRARGRDGSPRPTTPRRNPGLRAGRCPTPATTCAATARLAKNPITGVVLPNSGRADRAAGAEQRRLLQRPDPRQRPALPQRHLPAQPRDPRAAPAGLLVGSDRPPPDRDPRRIRHHRAALRRVRQFCRHVPVVGPGQAPADAVLWIAVGSRERALGVLAIAGHRMDTDRRPHPDDPQLLDRGATERRVQHGRHRGARRESASAAWSPRGIRTWCPRARASTRRTPIRPARPAPRCRTPSCGRFLSSRP